MKKAVIIACHLAFIAAGWFILSWFFFNSMAISAEVPTTADTPSDNGGGKQWHGHRGPQMLRLVMEELNLTDNQKSQVKSIIADEKPNIKPLMQQLKKGRQQLQSLTQNGAFDEKQVRSVATQQANTLAELIVIKERVKSKIFAVLTPEQRTEAQKLITLLAKSHRMGPLP